MKLILNSPGSLRENAEHVWKKMKEFIMNEQNKMGISIFAVTVFIVCTPLLSKLLTTGHDWQYHLLRIESIKEGLLSGQFPVRINPLFFNGYGYGSSLFYPDMFLYIPALLRMMGFSLTLSYKLFITLIVSLCFFTAYTCGKGISKSRSAGVAVAVVYCLSQYFLQNIYTRFALGEVQSFVFLPLIIYGLYNFLYEEFEKPWLIIAGFIGLLFCHLLAVVIALFVCIALSLFRFVHILRNPFKIKKLLVSAVIVLGVTAVFWLPFLEQLQTGSFQIEPGKIVSDMAVSVPTIISNSSTLWGSNCAFGASIILLCMARIFIEKSQETLLALRKINWAMLSGFGLLFLSSNLFPWATLPKIFNFLQFPWRFYALASLFLAVSIGLMYEVMSRKQYRKIGLFLLLLFMCASAVNVTTNSAKYTKVDDSYFKNAVNTYPIDGYEYLPKQLKSDKIRSLTLGERKVVADDGSSLSYTQKGLTLTVDYTMWFEYIDIPLLYYKGYSAWFVDVHGVKTPLPMDEKQHTIRVYTTDASETGSIVIEYTGTTVQLVSNILTLAFLFGLCAYGFAKRKGSKGTVPLLFNALRV